MPDVLAEVAARLHRCDISSLANDLAATDRDPSITAFLRRLSEAATLLGRSDLAQQADLLASEAPAATVLCHGDLHPFNVLVDGERWTLIDWSTAVLADPHYDLAFTTLMLANPPLGGPRPIRAIARGIGNRLARRFLRSYTSKSGTTIDPARLSWGGRVHALRALVELAHWEAAGELGARASHPWVQLRWILERELGLGQP
jgi:aminoglycoside phosphotransferase (APT) family kinase protein